jgi:hypothetical protein
MWKNDDEPFPIVAGPIILTLPPIQTSSPIYRHKIQWDRSLDEGGTHSDRIGSLQPGSSLNNVC